MAVAKKTSTKSTKKSPAKSSAKKAPAQKAAPAKAAPKYSISVVIDGYESVLPFDTESACDTALSLLLSRCRASGNPSYFRPLVIETADGAVSCQRVRRVKKG